MEKFNNIVLNVPHASIERYSEGWTSKALMFPLVKRWTDWHTDLLFGCVGKTSKVNMVRFPYSRFYCDAERLEHDPLEEKGQGIIYTQFEGFKRAVSASDTKSLMFMWAAHQSTLMGELKKDCERSIIIDCHSFPSDLADVDICIGFNEDWSKPEGHTIDDVVTLFSSNGYKVGVNYPYSNSITPYAEFRYKSLMIEVNKRCYMYEDKLELNNIMFPKFNKLINKLYLSLLTGKLKC